MPSKLPPILACENGGSAYQSSLSLSSTATVGIDFHPISDFFAASWEARGVMCRRVWVLVPLLALMTGKTSRGLTCWSYDMGLALDIVGVLKSELMVGFRVRFGTQSG